MRDPPRIRTVAGAAAGASPALAGADAGRRPSGAAARTIGVAPIVVPQYLDRSEIVIRRTATELTRLENDRRAEPFGVNVTRALVQNLAMLLPQYRVAMLPLRTTRRADCEVSLDLSAFEVDETRTAVLVGEGDLVDPTSGLERAGGRTNEAVPPGDRGDAGAIAAAMSRNLAELSADIAQRVDAMARERRRSGNSPPAASR
jgi:uncharacterized lipoprotein YmbA